MNLRAVAVGCQKCPCYPSMNPSVDSTLSAEPYRALCPWCKQTRAMHMIVRRRPPTPPRKRTKSPSKRGDPLPALVAPKASVLSTASKVSGNSFVVSSEFPPTVGPTEDRDVYLCGGCGGRSVRCRACSRAHARRGTPSHLRSDTAAPLWHSRHDPVPLIDDPEGVVRAPSGAHICSFSCT